jgi:hypothetical protein
MYSKQEASFLRRKFWTTFGQYMKPVTGADGSTINWLNYKTGIGDIYFRMDADTKRASVGIEVRHTDGALRREQYEKLLQLKTVLEETTGEIWNWSPVHADEDGRLISRISVSLEGVNIFNENDWPSIISFLKPRITALDEFWLFAKDLFL